MTRASRQAVLAALRSPVPAAGITPGTGRYRHHYAVHGPEFWGDDLAAAVDRFLAVRPDLDGSRVLDLGAGTGRHCFEAARRGAATVDAVEVDAVAGQAILEGTLRLEHAGIVPEGVIRLHQVNAVEYLRGAHAGYDLIICYGMLHVLPQDHIASVLSDAGRTLRPGGTLILQFLTNKFPAPPGQPELGDVWISPQYAARVLDPSAWDIWWRDDTDIRHSHISAGEHQHGSQRFLADRR